jgi:hypothetical protein
MLEVSYGEKQWVCCTRFFARIHLVTGKVLRLAIADFFPEPRQVNDTRFGTMLGTTDIVHESCYPVILETVERPLAYLRCPRHDREDELYFVKYSFSSKM